MAEASALGVGVTWAWPSSGSVPNSVGVSVGSDSVVIDTASTFLWPLPSVTRALMRRMGSRLCFDQPTVQRQEFCDL